MKITQLAAKPQLIKMILDDEETVQDFGETIEFWIWDRQPIEKFVKLATLKTDDFSQLITAVNEMVLDEDGKAVLVDGVTLPTNVMARLINKVVETLGK
jgi:hypothetical protein